MLREDEPEEPVAALSFGDVLGGEDHTATGPAERAVEPQLIDPEDIAFESEDGPEVEMPTFSVPVESPQAARPVPVPRPAPHPAPSVARAAPMPDPTLSRDMAEQLLAPTTDAAVKHTFAKLNGLSMVGSGVTLEDLMWDMLRPMLKEWLDENLPAVVERMVEKEIARISRGGE